MNAAAMSPRVSTWRAPSLPSRVNWACCSTKERASATAAWWACSIFAAISDGATAQSAETDFTGLNVRSNPATAVCRGREYLASAADSSRADAGSRPFSATKNSRAAVDRAVARSAGTGVGECASSSSTRALKASTVSLVKTLYAAPNGRPVIGSQPLPNRFRICSAVTMSPIARASTPARPEPIHRPGASPFAK